MPDDLRNMMITTLVDKGFTKVSIGQRFGITPNRVGQISKPPKKDTARELARQEAYQRLDDINALELLESGYGLYKVAARANTVIGIVQRYRRERTLGY